MLEILRGVFRKQNVTSVAEIHHPLGEVDTSASNVRPLIQVSCPAHRTTVNTHAYLKVRITFYFSFDVNCAFDWCFWASEKNQRHAIARRQRGQFVCRRRAELASAADNFIQLPLELM